MSAETQLVIEKLEAWSKEGREARDKLLPNPYAADTLAYYMHMRGWLERDLQLGLCRANPTYRKTQLKSGSITYRGISGEYGFEIGEPFIVRAISIDMDTEPA